MIEKPVSAYRPEYNTDMHCVPMGRKLIALTKGGVACMAVVTERNKHTFSAWCPLPKFPDK